MGANDSRTAALVSMELEVAVVVLVDRGGCSGCNGHGEGFIGSGSSCGDGGSGGGVGDGTLFYTQARSLIHESGIKHSRATKSTLHKHVLQQERVNQIHCMFRK